MMLKAPAPGYHPFREPVTIKCVVKRKKLIAEILGELDNAINPSFRIGFSDDTIFDVVASEDAGWSVSEKGNEHYLAAMQKELNSFLAVMHGDWYKFEITHDERNILIWVAYQERDDYPYAIHFDGDYQFHLKEGRPDWEAVSVRVMDTRSINREIVNKVVPELQKRIYL